MPSGTYKITEPMIEDLKIGIRGEHASNFGGIIAKAIADNEGIPAYSKRLTDKIKEMVSFIAPVEIVPGEDEMQALAEGEHRLLSKQENTKIYKDEVKL